jgi:hypothetical protein
MNNSKDYLILSIPTHDGRAVPKSIMDIMTVSTVLDRKFVLNVQTGTGLANTRQKCTEVIKELFSEEDHVYTFWLDSDITITNPNKIAEFVVEAERLGVSFTANYQGMDSNTGQRWNTVKKRYPESYTDEELRKSKPFELKCAYSGLGLCYIKTPLNYKFRTEGHTLEDRLFFEDNKQIDLRYVPIPNSHSKQIDINADL